MPPLTAQLCNIWSNWNMLS